MKRAQGNFSAASAKRYCPRAVLRVTSCVLLVAGSIFNWPGIVTAQQRASTVETPRAELEVQKLYLEVQKLELEVDKLAQAWVIGIVGLLVGAGSIVVAVWGGRKKTQSELDQSVHEKRLELYPQLVKATAQLALYFPPTGSIGPNECHSMGVVLRTWYFGGGGILLSTDARKSGYGVG